MAEFPRRRRWILVSAALLALAALFLTRHPRLVAPAAHGAGTLAGQRDPSPASLAGLASGTITPPTPVTFGPRALFAFVQPASSAALDAALPAPARKIYYVKVNAALIESKQSPFWQKPGEGRIEVPLPGGGAVSVVIKETQSLGPDRFTSTGEIVGRPGSRAIFAYNEGFLHASVEDIGLGTFALRTATEEVSQFYQIDPALIPPCGGSPRPVIDADAAAALAKRELKRAQQPKISGDVAGSSGGVDPTIPITGASAGTNVEIHLMVAYTQAVLTTLSGAARTAAIGSAIDAAVAQVNADFAASLITARVKLVKAVETQYSPDSLTALSSTVESDALDALRLTTDGKMDELHPLRDQVGADLVCLLVNRHDSSGTIGIAFILDTPGDNHNALFAFSVVDYNHASPAEHVVSHELGHNFGCAHDRENSPSQGAYPYSYGYRFFGKDQVLYHDIMAYDPGFRIGYYSTPNVIAPAPISVPVGIAAGQPGEADNARTIEQGAFEVATYRLQTQATYSAGTLQAVSTRAFVGPGEQALIGGFIITGTSKNVLIRAAGPALSAFLPNYLRDPVITLFDASSGQQRDFNNDWQTRPEASQIGGLPAGSKDAAMLITLPPGAYTANVTAADGGTGIARIDAYEADSSGARLYALSTRAYADGTNPMIGGFTVGGAAGTTKRMVIRVRGPSITGVTAMDDPYMEIYNANGDLIMINDDWSTNSVQLPNGTFDDFQPTVTTYKEQQIANSAQLYQTGLAPGNRREPAIMADFPPGNYTVVVKPFELLPAQVGKPGIAAVDVFEILPK